MTTDPKDLGELQKALNDAAGKGSVLWTTFITFELYLAIAFGSVTNRDLLLETPIKLPLLNVELPLVGFFVVAPTVLVIFHFYVLLQLRALATKARDYDWLLTHEAHGPSGREYLRQRLHSFLVLQFLAGPADQRGGFSGFSLRLIAWLTLVAAPVLVLLHGQVTFLPYHREWVVWLQRLLILFDLALIGYFWVRVHTTDGPIFVRLSRKIAGSVVSLCAIFVSVSVATFPGEWVEEHLPSLRVVPLFGFGPVITRPGQSWTSLHELLFAGEVDGVSGRPLSLFSNRLVLIDQSFVDADKLDKIEVSQSLRGRDLRMAVFDRTDLRKVDFTGAKLNGAKFVDAKLSNARFGFWMRVNSQRKAKWRVMFNNAGRRCTRPKDRPRTERREGQGHRLAIRLGAHAVSQVKFMALRRASSLNRTAAACAIPGSFLKWNQATFCPLASWTVKLAGCSTTRHAGGSRRASRMARLFVAAAVFLLGLLIGASVAATTLRDASPPARAPFITRLRDVMKDKYNIRDKFIVIASELDIADANSDIELFIRAKDKRDAIHKMSVPPEALPIHEARHLLRKYLELHLGSEP
jgi:Pentapeptide repeats (8 copies)